MQMNGNNSNQIVLDEIFDYVEIHSEYLRGLLMKVISIILSSIQNHELSFGPISERKTFSVEAGEVTEGGFINIDSEILRKYDDDVAMAIVAHELAHYYLRHYLINNVIDLRYEYEADELAQKWGFAIGKFRTVCGPPTCSPKP
jgi:hypothetical protein